MLPHSKEDFLHVHRLRRVITAVLVSFIVLFSTFQGARFLTPSLSFALIGVVVGEFLGGESGAASGTPSSSREGA
jgi:hypothetical protein